MCHGKKQALFLARFFRTWWSTLSGAFGALDLQLVLQKTSSFECVEILRCTTHITASSKRQVLQLPIRETTCNRDGYESRYSYSHPSRAIRSVQCVTSTFARRISSMSNWPPRSFHAALRDPPVHSILKTDLFKGYVHVPRYVRENLTFPKPNLTATFAVTESTNSQWAQRPRSGQTGRDRGLLRGAWKR